MNSTNTKLRAAVIGVGAMGQHHARVYTELAQTELVAVADSTPATGQRSAAKFGVPAYTDYRQMLERERLDLVTVAVPTRLHRQVVEHALEAGVHVLVEKPIAATEEEGAALIERARALDLKLMVGHIRPLQPRDPGVENAPGGGGTGAHLPNRLPADRPVPGSHPRRGSGGRPGPARFRCDALRHRRRTGVPFR